MMDRIFGGTRHYPSGFPTLASEAESRVVLESDRRKRGFRSRHAGAIDAHTRSMGVEMSVCRAPRLSAALFVKAWVVPITRCVAGAASAGSIHFPSGAKIAFDKTGASRSRYPA